MRENLLRSLLIATTALASGFAMGQWYVSTVPLGNFGGGELTFGGISPDGNVLLGGAYLNSNNRQAALLWSQSTGYRYFEEEPRSVVSLASSYAGGQVVGRGTSRGFSWTSGTGALWLNDLPGGSVASEAVDISGSGLRIVGWSSSYYSPNGEAVYWQGGVPTGLGAILGPQGSWSRCEAISLDGEWIIGNRTAGPFKYSDGTGVTALPLLSGAVQGYAQAVNRNGETIAGYCVDSSGRAQACIWRDGSVIGLDKYSLDSLSGTSAHAVSGDGSIVLGSNFIWTEGLGLYDFNSYLKQHGLTPPLYYYGRTQISDDGHTLATAATATNFQPLVFTKIGIGDTETVPRVTGRVVFSDLSESSAQPPLVRIDILDASEELQRFRWVSPGASGEFELFGPVNPGTYFVTVKYGHWLRRKVAVNLSGGNVSGVVIDLINGDIDHDNEIGIGDYAEMSATYGAVPGDFNWFAECDLNGDEAIDIGDYSILSANYGEVGD